ncbi:MAG: phage Gp37/Gp68 family protein [Aphanocapsa sp. GSE-SYN-MK-11-07L]|jgi:protein gp37|nr:phage Gp37/Gp68 family protein [Aphanocapsa sp. GSE-SYN-MK-11-07L]
MTEIEWTDETLNVFVGCSKVSDGCRNCYAIKQAYRNSVIAQTMSRPGRMQYYKGLTQTKDDRVDWTGEVRFVPEALEIPLKWKKARRIFVNSMSDLFHESIPIEQIDQVFAVMALTLQHTYQVLTKRPERMLAYLQNAKNRVRIAAVDLGRATKTEHTDIESCQWDWPPPNVWIGATVENQKALENRARPLYQLHNRSWKTFYSVEPLLENVELYLNHERVDWVIVGGESGQGARPFDLDWARSLIWQCKEAGVPVFMKQLGANCVGTNTDGEILIGKRSNFHPVFANRAWTRLSDSKGGDINEWPKDLQIREFPKEFCRV